MQDVPLYLKNTLRSLRIKFGYTQGEAARLLGVSIPTLRKWEFNSEKLSHEETKKIEEVYKISNDYIFFGSEIAFSEPIRGQRKNTA
jgi:transcriptional regulator with XRE-family HTH domain